MWPAMIAWSRSRTVNLRPRRSSTLIARVEVQSGLCAIRCLVDRGARARRAARAAHARPIREQLRAAHRAVARRRADPRADRRAAPRVAGAAACRRRQSGHRAQVSDLLEQRPPARRRVGGDPGNSLGLVRAPRGDRHDEVVPLSPASVERVRAILAAPMPTPVPDGTRSGRRRRAYDMPDRRTAAIRQRDACLVALLAYSGMRPSEAGARCGGATSASARSWCSAPRRPTAPSSPPRGARAAACGCSRRWRATFASGGSRPGDPSGACSSFHAPTGDPGR